MFKSIGVIADDFTGAMDTGVQFAKAGLETALLLSSEITPLVQIAVISTHSRNTEIITAQQKVADATRRLAGRLLFKKIDSTMRGHIGPEIEAVLEMAALNKAVVCPAVIEAGRRIRDGKLWVNNNSLHESDFARDLHWPAESSEMGDLVGSRVTHLPLNTVRAGATVLSHVIAEAPTPIVTVDAWADSDLAIIGQAIVAGRFLPCGALGLAQAWIKALVDKPLGNTELTWPGSPAPVLIVAGSRHPKTRTQVDRLVKERNLAMVQVAVATNSRENNQWSTISQALTNDRSVIICTPPEKINPAHQRPILEERLAALARRVCQIFKLSGLILTGGTRPMPSAKIWRRQRCRFWVSSKLVYHGASWLAVWSQAYQWRPKPEVLAIQTHSLES